MSIHCTALQQHSMSASKLCFWGYTYWCAFWYYESRSTTMDLVACTTLRFASGCPTCEKRFKTLTYLVWSCSSSWRYVLRVVKNLFLSRKFEKTADASNSIFKRILVVLLYKGSWVIARRKVKLVIEGLENVPRNGPVLVAARHFHHIYDGCVLMRAVPRRLHFFVAVDWVRRRWLRSFMELACYMVDWPIVLRSEQLHANSDQISQKSSRAYSLHEARIYIRHAMRDSVRILRDGEALVVFPEAYPDIDPRNTARVENHASLPFRPGFARLVEMVEKDEHTRVAIVPAGLSYEQNGRWNVTLRFGLALSRSDYIDYSHLVQDVEMRVRELSDVRTGTLSMYAEETIRL
jgi:1-acyl-sn-glycerol-3-phosphate acyltransferase